MSCECINTQRIIATSVPGSSRFTRLQRKFMCQTWCRHRVAILFRVSPKTNSNRTQPLAGRNAIACNGSKLQTAINSFLENILRFSLYLIIFFIAVSSRNYRYINFYIWNAGEKKMKRTNTGVKNDRENSLAIKLWTVNALLMKWFFEFLDIILLCSHLTETRCAFAQIFIQRIFISNYVRFSHIFFPLLLLFA